MLCVVKAQQLRADEGGQAGDRRWKSQADGAPDDDSEGQGVKTQGAGNLNTREEAKPGKNKERRHVHPPVWLQFRKSEPNLLHFHK